MPTGFSKRRGWPVADVTELRPSAEAIVAAHDRKLARAVPDKVAAVLTDYQDQLFDALGSLRVLERLLNETDECSDVNAAWHTIKGAANLVEKIGCAIDREELTLEVERREVRSGFSNGRPRTGGAADG